MEGIIWARQQKTITTCLPRDLKYHFCIYIHMHKSFFMNTPYLLHNAIFYKEMNKATNS